MLLKSAYKRSANACWIICYIFYVTRSTILLIGPADVSYTRHFMLLNNTREATMRRSRIESTQLHHMRLRLISSKKCEITETKITFTEYHVGSCTRNSHRLYEHQALIIKTNLPIQLYPYDQKSEI